MKPTQHSVKELRAIGIQPDILLCRSDHALPQEMKEKIALFCDVDVQAVVTARDVESVYGIHWYSPNRAWTKSRCDCSPWIRRHESYRVGAKWSAG